MNHILLNLHLVLVAIVVFRLLTRDTIEPANRLAWILVTAIAPFLGVILYLLFGETRRGLKTNMRVKVLVGHLKHFTTPLLGDMSLVESMVDTNYQPAFHYAYSINHFGATIGNVAELLPNEPIGISRLIDDIDQAQTSICLITYIWLSDKTGTAVAEALMRAARRGVDCKVMADGLGSRDLIHSKLWVGMREAGVRVSIAQPFPNIIKTILFSRLDLRNHRKIIVIDHHITYCGSRNLTDEFYSKKPKYAPWVDMVVRFEGPVAMQNQLLFGSDWLLQDTGDISAFAREVKPATSDGAPGVLAQVWGVGPTERYKATPQMFATLIDLARHTMVITTPYFVPGETVISSLCAAALRGVDVTLILPERNDSWVVAGASRSYYSRLLAAGIHLHHYRGGLLHTKSLTIDGVVSMFGSANLDLRSFDLNYENNILVHDRDLTAQILMRQHEYLESSVAVTPGMVANWPLLKRVWNNVLATIGPIL